MPDDPTSAGPQEVPLLVTPEKLRALLDTDLRTYQDRGQRVAIRAALGDAAGLCDFMAAEIVAQNNHRGRVNRRIRDLEAAFKRCGDEIWRMRDQVKVDVSA